MNTTHELEAAASLLDLEEFEVVEVEADRGKTLRRFTLLPKAAAGLWPHCGRVTDDRHACHDREVADLPMGAWGTRLVVRPWQFHCRARGKFFTPPLRRPARGGARHRAAAGAAGGVGRSGRRRHRRPLLRAGGEDGGGVVLPVPAAAGGGAGGRPAAGAVAGDRRAVPQKRRRQFCRVLIDHANGRVPDVLESGENAAVVAWLESHKSGLLAGLEEVTCDMWDAYAEAARQVFGDAARVTVDRFHVMKNFQDRLNEARREVQRGLPKERAKELKG